MCIRDRAYSVYSQLQTNDHSNMLIGATSTKNERAAESLTVIQEQIANLGADGPTEDELDKAKKYLTGSYALRFDTSVSYTHLLVMAWNPGISYSWLSAETPTGRMALLGIALTATLILCVWLWRNPLKITGIALGFLIGGALGNAWDRYTYGAVADFFHFHVGSFSWYVFNRCV